MVNYALISAIFLGTSPALIWLIFFLKKDKNPEPKKIIAEIFLYGMIFSLIALYLFSFIQSYLLSFFFLSILFFAFLEELSKYSVIRLFFYQHPELDEPVDFMIYLITAGLGFAAMENILLSFQDFLLKPNAFFESMFLLNVFRFLGATFLHALLAGILGYFLFLSFYYAKKQILITGFSLVVLLHVLFNLAMINVIKSTEAISFVIYLILLSVLIIGMLITVLHYFKKLKKIKKYV